jgi:hypothetical protein
MRSLGFNWVWLDGDREAAHRAYTARGPGFDAPGVAEAYEQDWVTQLDKIVSYIDFDALDLRVVDPFDQGGRFRPTAEVAAEVLKDSASATPA